MFQRASGEVLERSFREVPERGSGEVPGARFSAEVPFRKGSGARFWSEVLNKR